MGYLFETNIAIFGKEGLIQKKMPLRSAYPLDSPPTEFLFPPMHTCIAVPIATDNYDYLLLVLLQLFM